MLLAEDSRLTSVGTKQRKECTPSWSTNPNQEAIKQKPDFLFDRRIVRKYLAAAIPEAKLNQLRSNRVGPVKLKHYKVINLESVYFILFLRFPYLFRFGIGVQPNI